LAARESGRALLTACGDDTEAALVADLKVYAGDTLTNVCRHLSGLQCLPETERQAEPRYTMNDGGDLSDIHGQYQAKRVLEIAASGGHNLLMLGPPGKPCSQRACPACHRR
jgi:magnesium chelatase family protein